MTFIEVALIPDYPIMEGNAFFLENGREILAVMWEKHFGRLRETKGG